MPICQGQHLNGSPCRNTAPEGQTHCYVHRDGGGHLQAYQVQGAIEENGGSGGLDLSHEDLGQVALPKERLQGIILEGAFLEDANLSGADLGDANLRGARLVQANLSQTDFTKADLTCANLQQADLRAAKLTFAKLQDASLWQANLEDAELDEADLRGTHLRSARLKGADLGAARTLDGGFFFGAFLDKTRIRREQLGVKIGEELAAETGRGGSYNHAREAYLALKTNFNELGRYDDASWAYRKERRMERAMSRPSRAAREHKEEKESLGSWLGRPWFYIKHTLKWLTDGLIELTTDYGEAPWRMILTALGVWFLFGLAYGLVGSVGPAELAKVNVIRVFDLGAVLTYSAAAMGTVGLESLRPLDRLTEVLTAIEGIFGISLLAMLMFTLGNRISRS